MNNNLKYGLSNKYYISLVCKIINALTGFILSILLSRWLGVVDKGELAYIIEVVEIGYTLFGLSLGTTYLTYKKKYGIEIRYLFVLLTIVHSFVSLLFGWIIFLLGNNITFDIILLTAVSIIWSNFNLIAVIEDNIVRNLIYTMIDIAHIVFIVICYLCGINGLDIAVCALGISRIVFIFFVIKKYNLFKGDIHMRNINFKDIYKDSFITMAFMLLITLNYKLDVVMMKFYSNSYNIGIYSVATTLSNLFLLIPDAFKEALFGDSLKKDFRHSTFASIKVSFVLSAILFLAYLVFGKSFIEFFYGEVFSSSFYVLCILWVATLPLGIFKILQPLYIANSMQKSAVYYLSVAVFVNMCMNFMILPIYGCYGAAISTTVSYSVCCILFIYGLRKHTLI